MKRHDVTGPNPIYPPAGKVVILWSEHENWFIGWRDPRTAMWRSGQGWMIDNVVAWSDPTEPGSAEPFAWALTSKLFGGPRPLTAYNNRQLAEDVAAAIDPSLQVVPLYATPPDTAPAWRPIETAPKDGTEILLMGEHGVSIAIWSHDPKVPEPGDSVRELWLSPDDYYSYPNPTHWMPLPPPPGESAPTVDHTAVMRQAAEALAELVAIFDHPTRHVSFKEADRARAALAALRGALPQPKESQHDH